MIRAVLERAAVAADAAALSDALEDLRVVNRCSCGCDSVEFTNEVPVNPSRPIAEGVGTTPGGGTVGVIVWGRDYGITGLEIYDLGAVDDGLRLPDPGSIRPFEGGAA